MDSELPGNGEHAIADALREPVWAWALLGQAAQRPGWDARAAVEGTLAHGQKLAREIRERTGGATVAEVAQALALSIVRSAEDPQVGWRHRRSEYDPARRQVTLYARAVAPLAQLAARFGLGDVFTPQAIEDLCLAHEIYHHLEVTREQMSDRYRRVWIRVGPLCLTVREPALDEIAAHRFAQELCGLALSPAILDLLTIRAMPEAAQHLLAE